MFNLTAISTNHFIFKNWHFTDDKEFDKEEGITITFPFFFINERRKAILKLRSLIKDNNFYWLIEQDRKWFLNLDELKNSIDELKNIEWLKGIIEVSLEFDKEIPTSRAKFILTKDEVIMSYPKKIFLCHKSSDKQIVRNIKNILTLFGFEVWLDEEMLNAGDNLERELLQGFKDSCAAVFFITSSFVDSNYLATEIDYARIEKRNKKDRFSIITLLFSKAKNEKIQIPELLKTFVRKEPKNEFDALVEIIKALPIEVGSVKWKAT